MSFDIRTLVLTAPFFLFHTACGGLPESSGTPPEQLEAIAITGASSAAQVDLEGTLTVSGGERDFTVTIADPALGEIPFEIHTPTMADLSSLDSVTATFTVSQQEGWSETARSVVISDDEGPIYVANVGHGIDLDAMFGKGFVTWGDPVATEIIPQRALSSDDYEEKSYTPAVFKTDTGDVVVAAGEVSSIQVAGVLYRVAVISAFTVEYHTEEELGCGESSTLSFEMIRVDTNPEPLKLTRPAHLGPASLGCI